MRFGNERLNEDCKATSSRVTTSISRHRKDGPMESVVYRFDAHWMPLVKKARRYPICYAGRLGEIAEAIGRQRNIDTKGAVTCPNKI
jgi:hypothetical protein